MKMEKRDYNAASINAIAVLLEFYETDLLSRFYSVSKEYDLDTIEGFIGLKEILVQCLAIDEKVPDFSDLAEIYVSNKGFNLTEFSKRLCVG